MKRTRVSFNWIRPLRLWTGLIMFAFLLSHFSNHALGLVSLSMMEDGRSWFASPWRQPAMQFLLLFALLSHWLLGLWLIYRRHTLRMPIWEAVQILVGLAVPPLLVFHAFGMYQAYQIFGTEDLYARVIYRFTTVDPMSGVLQIGLFVVAWTHGIIGLHFWLRIRSWYSTLFPMLLVAAVLVPVLAALGIGQAAREVSTLTNDSGYVERLNRTLADPTGGNSYGSTDSYGSGDSYSSGDSYGSGDSYSSSGAYGSTETATTQSETDKQTKFTTIQLRDAIFVSVWLLLGLTLLGRLVRKLITRRRGSVTIRYLGGPKIHVPQGWTILEASRSARRPHASVCGGRARCSTCRVRIGGDPANQPAPTQTEQRVLDRIKAAPNVRLACQLRPQHDLTITPLIPVAINTGSTGQGLVSRGGEERELAILFADLRGFTRVAERKLPYDVVFLLNRYFEAVGGAIAQAGGIANQYTGDGVMALFGVNTDRDTACRQAIKAAGAIISRIDALSENLGNELEAPLQLGIGIHVGSVVLGEMGYAQTRYLTAVGDTVNTTSRLEALTKEHQCQLIVSEKALELAGVAASDLPHHEVMLRNREEPLRVVVVGDARDFATRVNPPRILFNRYCLTDTKYGHF